MFLTNASLFWSDFSLTDWLSDLKITDTQHLPGDVIDKLFKETGLDIYLNDQECSFQNKTAKFQSGNWLSGKNNGFTVRFLFAKHQLQMHLHVLCLKYSVSFIFAITVKLVYRDLGHNYLRRITKNSKIKFKHSN